MEKKDATAAIARGKIIQIDEAQVRDHLAEIVRGSVEETLNTMLQKESTSCARRDATSAMPSA
jgi:hypothetical protein